eukprot:TRINITY_DN3326_c0_g2_i2.p1 TRINITY_DN3326_c0_g2~~TRINITY_DN3326_c0_g2_i2.p1  ORF type:complete len:461 (+),score=133.55 TRINITY_DN3326_c0_g2_i2:1162-2544(+)
MAARLADEFVTFWCLIPSDSHLEIILMLVFIFGRAGGQKASWKVLAITNCAPVTGMVLSHIVDVLPCHIPAHRTMPYKYVNDEEEEDDETLAEDKYKLEGYGNGSIPPLWKLHGAMLICQLSFGGGAIVGKLGVSGTNPVLFALIREGIAGPILVALALIQKVEYPRREHLLRLFAAGVCIFLNQFAFIVGLKLSDPTTGSVWQPSQPIFTCMLAIFLGYEQPDWKKILGIVFAFAGATCMIVLPGGDSGGSSSSGSGGSTTNNPVAGNVLFFVNCLATSCYVILTKPLLSSKTYMSISVTGWSYITASVLMAIAAVIINSNNTTLDFVCPSHDCKGAWDVPTSMILALVYWVLFNSVVAYMAMTWANAYLKASVVSAYTVIQPLTSFVLSVLIIAIKGKHWAVDDKGFAEPSFKDFGGVGILIGLALVVSSSTVDEASKKQINEESEYESDASTGIAIY